MLGLIKYGVIIIQTQLHILSICLLIFSLTGSTLLLYCFKYLLLSDITVNIISGIFGSAIVSLFMTFLAFFAERKNYLNKLYAETLLYLKELQVSLSILIDLFEEKYNLDSDSKCKIINENLLNNKREEDICYSLSIYLSQNYIKFYGHEFLESIEKFVETLIFYQCEFKYYVLSELKKEKNLENLNEEQRKEFLNALKTHRDKVEKLKEIYDKIAEDNRIIKTNFKEYKDFK